MHVEVEELHYDTVWFTAPGGGTGIGVWRGKQPCPPGGCDVELTVPTLHWGVDAEVAADGQEPGFDRNEIVADVEQVGDDGVVTLRAGRSLFFADFSGEPRLAAGQRLVLRPTVVELYPTNV